MLPQIHQMGHPIEYRPRGHQNQSFRQNQQMGFIQKLVEVEERIQRNLTIEIMKFWVLVQELDLRDLLRNPLHQQLLDLHQFMVHYQDLPIWMESHLFLIHVLVFILILLL